MTSFPYLEQRELPMAVLKALENLVYSTDGGSIGDIDFEMGRPRGGLLPFRIIVDGRVKLLCELTDVYPFLERLRDWMERCLIFDRHGQMGFESIKLDCRDDVYLLMLCQAGGDYKVTDDKILSSIIVARNMSSLPIIYKVCPLFQVLGRLYSAITRCIERNRAEFNNPKVWYDIKRFDPLDERDTADRLLEKIHSREMENILILEK